MWVVFFHAMSLCIWIWILQVHPIVEVEEVEVDTEEFIDSVQIQIFITRTH